MHVSGRKTISYNTALREKNMDVFVVYIFERENSREAHYST